MSDIDRAIRDYERESLRRYDEWNDRELARTAASKIDPDEPRPHGENPAIFDGPCDCDECQLWDQMQREQ